MPLLAGFLALSPCLASASPFSTTGPGRTAWILQPSATSIFTLFFDGPGFRPPHQNLSLPAFFETALPLASLDDAPGADASHHSDPYPSLLFGAVGLLSVALLICAVTLYRQRALRKRLALQSQQILETKAILVEAQRNAHLGIWRYDTKNKSLVCSEETLRILDRGGSRGSPTYFRLLTSIPKTERALVHRALRGVLRDGIPCEITATCRTRQALRILHATAQPTRNKEGAVTGLFGTVQDITRQKAAEEGLRAREQLLRALYENVPTAMGVIEEAGSSLRVF